MNKSNKKWLFIISTICLMIFILVINISYDNGIVVDGYGKITSENILKNKTVHLDGEWEFYWDKLLTPETFMDKNNFPKYDTLVKVPGSWSNIFSDKYYPIHGVGTYRLQLRIPKDMKNPSIKIKRIMRSYNLYVNSNLVASGGSVSKEKSLYKPGYKFDFIELPKNNETIEIILQVSNFDYFNSGIRDSLVFGEKIDLESETEIMLNIQIILFGAFMMFALYYLVFFLFQRNNNLALLLSLLSFFTAFRNLIWGEYPIYKLFPQLPIEAGAYINYITGYNLMPVVILIVFNIYKPLKKNKTHLYLILPSIIMNYFILFGVSLLPYLNNLFYFVILVQMIYIVAIIIKHVFDGRRRAGLMHIAVCTIILIILFDILTANGYGSDNVFNLSLLSTVFVIFIISIIESGIQYDIKNQLLKYNETLVEMDKLKDKVRQTELSFLQAQIKPHFLYNSLNAIANVCEKDGILASSLIVDLAVYLRGSLEFNEIDKMSTIYKEIDYAKTYFNIEKARFGNKINLVINNETRYNFNMPFLVLQPLIENAIRHGLAKKMTRGEVTISIKEKDEAYHIEIIDNGIGMKPEKLISLLSENSNSNSFGLLNIHTRLLMLYKKGLTITSSENIGTTVSFSVQRRIINESKDCSN